MARFETDDVTQGDRKHCEDRVAVSRDDERTIIVVADGAGGIGNFDAAAQSVIREVTADYQKITTAEQWEAELRQIDSDRALANQLRSSSICGPTPSSARVLGTAEPGSSVRGNGSI